MHDDLKEYILEHERALRNWNAAAVQPRFRRPPVTRLSRSKADLETVGLAVHFYEELLERRIENLCISMHGEAFDFSIDERHRVTLFHYFCERFADKILSVRPENYRNKLLMMNVLRTSSYYKNGMDNIGAMLKIAVAHHSFATGDRNEVEMLVDGQVDFGRPRNDAAIILKVLDRAERVGEKNCRFYAKFIDRLCERYGERFRATDPFEEKFPSDFSSCRTTLYKFSKTHWVPEAPSLLERIVPMNVELEAGVLFRDFDRALKRLAVRKAG